MFTSSPFSNSETDTVSFSRAYKPIDQPYLDLKIRLKIVHRDSVKFEDHTLSLLDKIIARISLWFLEKGPAEKKYLHSCDRSELN